METSQVVPALVVDKLVKHYAGKKSVHAVNGISFEVRPGECYGLLGPNGAGKSTTINCIIGFFPTTSGSAKVLGYDVHHEPKKARQLLGTCPQEDTLDTDFTVINQLIRHATFFRIEKKEATERARELLSRFALTSKADELVESLSGGMRRRLQVARALISNPKVLVLDEPTTGLDPDARRSLWDVLEHHRAKGLAVLLTTHYMEEAERLCDRIMLLHNGVSLDEDTPRNLITKHVPTEWMEEEIRPGVKWKRPSNLEDVYLKVTGSKLGAEAAEEGGRE